MSEEHVVRSLGALEGLYGRPRPQSLLKEVATITPEYRAWIESSPLVVLASVGAAGVDCTPRGDAGRVVHVLDERRLLLPDRPGNNRIDTMRNLIEDPRVALLFLIPGRSETIRVIGRAVISTDPAMLQLGAVDGKLPRSALLISVDSVYYQCARALIRSAVWSRAEIERERTLPTMGDILSAIDRGGFDGKAYDEELTTRLARTLY